MKAIILAAGKGERFGSITKTLPKPLIQLGKMTLIEHNILLLKKYGFLDLIINVSYLSSMIIDFIGNGEKYGINITYSVENKGPLETGGGIHNALSFLGNNPFLVINSDIYTNCKLSSIEIEKNDNGVLVMVENPAHNLNGDFSCSNGRVVSGDVNKMTYAGISILNPIIFENFKLGKYKLIDVLIKEISNNKISAFTHDGIWCDVGDIEKLENAKKLLP
ncbi:nucleotidyltransferase family protein [Gammaproteobacteria bacterium]|nr:nucleotidyltransferase family protein [Gammaproteobacteria bacterium]